MRIKNYVQNMCYEIGVIAHSRGVREPRRSHARIVNEKELSIPLDELYGQQP